MAITAAPFALKNLGLDAEPLRQALASLVPNAGGIVAAGDLAVSQTTTPSLGVQVGVGRAWMPGTNTSNLAGQSYSTQGQYFAINDAPLTVNLATANATNPRIDVIYIGAVDTFYGGATDAIVIDKVTGTPAATPTVPTLPPNAIALAKVAVAANATTILNANITSLITRYAGTQQSITAAIASPNPTYWTAIGTLVGEPVNTNLNWSGYIQLTRLNSTLVISTTAYTDLGPNVIPAIAQPSYGSSQYVRGILTGGGIHQPCTVFVNFQTGDVSVRADAAVTLAVGSLLAFNVNYIS